MYVLQVILWDILLLLLLCHNTISQFPSEQVLRVCVYVWMLCACVCVFSSVDLCSFQCYCDSHMKVLMIHCLSGMDKLFRDLRISELFQFSGYCHP